MMGSKIYYVVYWFSYTSGKKKKLTCRRFDTMEEAEAFADEKLNDAAYKTIRRYEDTE